MRDLACKLDGAVEVLGAPDVSAAERVPEPCVLDLRGDISDERLAGLVEHEAVVEEPDVWRAETDDDRELAVVGRPAHLDERRAQIDRTIDSLRAAAIVSHDDKLDRNARVTA